jgi:hypothetical protein
MRAFVLLLVSTVAQVVGEPVATACVKQCGLPCVAWCLSPGLQPRWSLCCLDVLTRPGACKQTLGFQVLVQAPARRGGAAGLVSPSLAPAAATLRAPRRSPRFELKAAATVDVEDAATV